MVGTRKASSRKLNADQYAKLRAFVISEVEHHSSVGQFYTEWARLAHSHNSVPYVEETFRQILRGDPRNSVQNKFLVQLAFYLTEYSQRLAGTSREWTAKEAGDWVFDGKLPARDKKKPSAEGDSTFAKILDLLSQATESERLDIARMALGTAPVTETYSISSSGVKEIVRSLTNLDVNPFRDEDLRSFAEDRGMDFSLLRDTVTGEQTEFALDQVRQLQTIVASASPAAGVQFEREVTQLPTPRALSA